MPTQHGKVQIIKQGATRPRTVSAALWGIENNAFKKRGYVLFQGAPKPVGVSEKPAKTKPAKAPANVEPAEEQPAKAPANVEPAEEQPEQNVEMA